MREEADLDALVTRIQSDLRSGRGPAYPPPPKGIAKAKVNAKAPPSPGELRFRAELREIRGRPRGRAWLADAAARWLAPSLIFLAVLAAVWLFDKP